MQPVYLIAGRWRTVAMPHNGAELRLPPPGHAFPLFTPVEWDRIADALHFSLRELQVLQGLSDDLKELAIARRLGISQPTVHTHCQRMYRKLGVHSQTELLVRVLAQHVADLNDQLQQANSDMAAGKKKIDRQGTSRAAKAGPVRKRRGGKTRVSPSSRGR
jgi:DNA-binding CsgD family transcriptional regulator